MWALIKSHKSHTFSFRIMLKVFVLIAIFITNSKVTEAEEMPLSTQHNHKARNIPIIVGTTNDPFYLGKDMIEISFPIQNLPENMKTKKRVFLTIKNLTSLQKSPSFKVYVNLPLGQSPVMNNHMVGTLSMYGLVESSQPGHNDLELGLTYLFEMTKIYEYLIAQNLWDNMNIRIAFVPHYKEETTKVQVKKVLLSYEMP